MSRLSRDWASEESSKILSGRPLQKRNGERKCVTNKTEMGSAIAEVGKNTKSVACLSMILCGKVLCPKLIPNVPLWIHNQI
jgi:hypothetical protein